jgi:hypothetical protein
MSTKAFTCDSIVPEKSAMEQREEQLRKSCPCKALLADDRRLHEKPYFLISVDQKTAVVKQTGGKSITVREKETLPTGELVFEIRPTAVILTKGSDRMIINQYPNPECVDVCSKPAVSSAGNVQIKPYRLTFTKNECDTLLYYASFLVDMNKPFTGREKCMTGANGTSQDEMLALIQQRAATSAGDDETDSYSAQPPVRPVSYQLPNDPTAPEKFVMPRVMPSMAPDKSTPQAREALRVRRVLDKEAANKRRQDALKEKEEAEKNPPSKAKVK